MSGEGSWVCADCEYENEAADAACAACEAPRPSTSGADDGKYKGFKIGAVLTCEEIPGKDKLKKLSVDIGSGSPVTIVTNAPNVAEGSRVVVATVGAMVGDEAVKKSSVGGVMSEGMLCSNPMLGWSGGGAKTAALVPADDPAFAPGNTPPEKAPRLK
eukprot:CAMPEP_0202860494 /NCGR_PEP_ID=MMETSP1391-20130828/2168_1 /ASSEMBLY_ACC=CAM_ASM_000867 /TAXON_ID=1034604 /ORGANISM="Chlamydomonas leiostraca, Strain SAG 11-49" /LENGTH=157 /DNA_ID=CAMNT_0049539659 /DNA_START=20 /DNA_END=493 /DNA_ORIENTATION=-